MTIYRMHLDSGGGRCLALIICVVFDANAVTVVCYRLVHNAHCSQRTRSRSRPIIAIATANRSVPD